MSSQLEIAGSARDNAIYIAKQELKRQNAMLPKAYDVVVENAEAGNELEAPRQVYQVSFSFYYRGRKQIIYTVIIDKRSGRVELFSDSRTSIPSEV